MICCFKICGMGPWTLLLVTLVSLDIIATQYTLQKRVDQLISITDSAGLNYKLWNISLVLLIRNVVEGILAFLAMVKSYWFHHLTLQSKIESFIAFRGMLKIVQMGATMLMRLEVIAMVTEYNLSEDIAEGNHIAASEPEMIIYWSMFAVGYALRLLMVMKLLAGEDKIQELELRHMVAQASRNVNNRQVVIRIGQSGTGDQTLEI